MSNPVASKPRRPPGDDNHAVESVLAAERAAERAIEAAARDAEARLAEARERARAIQRRAEERVQRAITASVRSTDDEVARLQGEHVQRAEQVQRRLADEACLDRAVARVADWLLSAEEGGDTHV